MKRLSRHVFVLILFFYLVLVVSFCRLLSLNVFDPSIAYENDVHEQRVEPRNYVRNITHELSMMDEKHEKKLRKVYKKYPSFPGWDSVIDNRTLVDSDYYTSLNLRCLSGANHRAAAEQISQKIKTDSVELKKSIDKELKLDKIYSIIENEEAESRNSDASQRYSGGRRQRLESPGVERVEPLPPGTPRTPPNEQTRLDREDLAAIHPLLRKKVKRNEVKYFDIPRRRATRSPTYRWKSFYIAINLFNNEDVLPFMTEALVAFIEDELAPFFDIRTSVVVTIYASISKDLTGSLIRSLMIPYLQKAGVEVIFATVSGGCQGYVERQLIHERIEWLQCVRNRAMEPLQEFGMHIFPKKSNMGAYEHRDNAGGGGLEFNVMDFDDALGKPRGDPREKDDLVVLFLNDIYFRPSDLTRLLETEPEEQMAAQIPLGGAPKDPAPAGTPQEHARESKDRVLPRPAFDVACGMDFYYFFYDTWVSRDHRGGPFLSSMPYSNDPATRRAIARALARPPLSGPAGVLVKCCWNGAAAIRGGLFLPPSPVTEGAIPPSPVTEGAIPLSSLTEETPFPSLVTLLSPLVAHAPGTPSVPALDLVFCAPRPLLCGLLRCEALGMGGGAEGPVESLAWWEHHLNAYIDGLSDGVANLSTPKHHDSASPPFRLTVLRVDKSGVCAKVPYMTPVLSKSPLFRSFRLPSGAIFDRVGHNHSIAAENEVDADQSKVKFMMELQTHYEHVLVRRLVNLHELWHDAHTMVTKLSRRKMSPVFKAKKSMRKNITALQDELHEYVSRHIIQIQNNISTLYLEDSKNEDHIDEGLTKERVAGLFHWIKLMPNAPLVNSCAFPKDNRPNSIPKPQYASKQKSGSSLSHSLIAENTSSTSERYVLNDAVYYQARNPTLHFRHSFTPSLGAAILKKGYDVDDNVCLSSECLLFCEDVMHTTLLREGRTPVILMNPLVQLAYEKSHFDRLTHTWLYTSPRLFYFAAWVSDALQFCLRVGEGFFQSFKYMIPFGGDNIVKAKPESREQQGQHPSDENTSVKNPAINIEHNSGSIVSAMDDMLYGTPANDFLKGPLSVVIGHRRQNQSGERRDIDFVSYTSMTCSGYSSGGFKILFNWIYRIGITFAIVLQLLFLYRDVNSRIQAKFLLFVNELDSDNQKGHSTLPEELLPQDWGDAFLLLDSDQALMMRLPSQSPPFSEIPENTPVIDVNDLEQQKKKYRMLWKRFVAPDTNPNLCTDLLDTSAVYALSPEERLWIRIRSVLKTRSPWWTFFRPRMPSPKWCKVSVKMPFQRGGFLLCRRFSKLYWAPKMIWAFYQKGMRKSISKMRQVFPFRKNWQRSKNSLNLL